MVLDIVMMQCMPLLGDLASEKEEWGTLEGRDLQCYGGFAPIVAHDKGMDFMFAR